MKEIKPLLEVISILFIALIFLTVYSFADFDLSFQLELKKPPIKAFLTPPPSTHFLASTLQQHRRRVLDSVLNNRLAQKKLVDSSSHTILLTGDSMCEGLMFRFRDYAKYNQHKLKTVIWYGSTTERWSKTDSLQKLVKKYNPDYIFFTTGSNELFIRNIQDREVYIQDIVKQAGERKFIWIGPPNWAKDTGINDLIVKNVGEDRFFESKNLTFKRAADGAHPTWSSAAVWADTISSWVMRKSRHKILLQKPKDLKKKNS